MADDGGLSRFQARLRAIPAAVKAAAIPAVREAGHELADVIEQLAPQDSGKLKNSIAVTPPGQSTPPYSQPGGSQVAKETEVLVTVGDKETRYPHLVEYGTKHTPAHPFFWPAVRLNRKRLTTKLKRAVSKAVRDNWGSK